MKTLLITLGLMTAFTLGRAQEWAYDTSVPYMHQQLSEEDPMEGKIPLGKDEIPSEVIHAFQNSPFQHMTIIQAFRLQDQALEKVIMREGSEQPLFLYELRLAHDGKQSCLYFTKDGELYQGDRSV
jgi:hypothetical protein